MNMADTEKLRNISNAKNDENENLIENDNENLKDYHKYLTSMMHAKSRVPHYQLYNLRSTYKQKKNISKNEALDNIMPNHQSNRTISTSTKANEPQDANDGFVQSNTLSELRSNLAKIDLPFKKYATTMVFADGKAESPLMLIGEAPGQEEDKQGKPFVGDSGKLLESILNAAGIYRKNYYITNIVPWRPPGNRTPTIEEINIMRPYVLDHIRIISPKIVVLIGSVAYKTVMNQTKAITTVRGQFIKQDNILYIPVFHPSYLLRSPSKKKEMWHDVLTIKRKIQDLNLNILE